jgi:hypothetical protein
VGTGLSTHPGLEGFRADLSQRAVTPLAFVVDFNVFKHGLTYLGAGAETLTVNTLDFQAVEETILTAPGVAYRPAVATARRSYRHTAPGSSAGWPGQRGRRSFPGGTAMVGVFSHHDLGQQACDRDALVDE